MGDQLSAPGGFLGGFLLAGIFLPIAVSFLVDGTLLYFRGRGPTRLLSATVVTLLIVGLYSVVWQNTMQTGDTLGMTQSIGLILWFSIPAAALGLGVRVLALFLNPATKQLDQDAIALRRARQAARLQAQHVAQPHGVRHA